jgi:hypothetical protein
MTDTMLIIECDECKATFMAEIPYDIGTDSFCRNCEKWCTLIIKDSFNKFN